MRCTKEGIQWEQWQALQLKALEDYKRSNRKVFGERFSVLNGRVDEMLQGAYERGGTEQEVRILKAIQKGLPLRKTPDMATAAFFRLNQRKMDTLIKATLHDMQRAETAVLRMADDKYRKIIFNAQVYANSGAGTYEKAVDMATKDFLSAGLNCIEYKTVPGIRYPTMLIWQFAPRARGHICREKARSVGNGGLAR